MSTQDHREQAAGQTAACGVLTVSDTRTLETDRGGAAIADALTGAGHQLAARDIVRDEPAEIEFRLRQWLGRSPRGVSEPAVAVDGVAAPVWAGQPLDVIITTGGTGIASRDTTIEVVRRLLDKELEGFGELFRMLSWEQVGAAAMLSRAVGGLAGETLVFALPGSVNAVTLAMEKLLIPELPHLVWERRR